MSLGLLWAATSQGEPLRLRGDALAEARSPAGLIVLQGEGRKYPWIGAEALVWTGAGNDEAKGDVLVLMLRLREPRGLGELRAGRFVFATGAIRPVQLDGVWALGRTPWGLTIEAAGGAPVIPRFGARAYDWLWGGRVAQNLASQATVGFSYVRQHAREGLTNEEVGADLSAIPIEWLDVAARGAYDLASPGIADALVSAAARFEYFRVELFASHRSPSRLLPATSLFSVLGDFPSQVVGTTVRWEAAPRLDLLATVAGQDLGGELGGYGSLRSTLRLDDRGDGSLGLEVRRQDVANVHWSGVRAIATQHLDLHWQASSELELAWADDPQGRGNAWPWGLLALGWRSGTGWEAAAAIEAGASPRYRFEMNGLLRLSRTFEVP